MIFISVNQDPVFSIAYAHLRRKSHKLLNDQVYTLEIPKAATVGREESPSGIELPAAPVP